jgi:ribose 5-phosphate isomerase A
MAHMTSAVAPEDRAKYAAAYQAVTDNLNSTHRFIGIGSGSTIVYVVRVIASLGGEITNNMVFIPTGSQSKALIKHHGLKLCNLDERPVSQDGLPVPLDLAFDGADEIDADLNCIKGGGACLLQEKLVATAAKRFIVVAEQRKLSDRLCRKWASIPIEVVPLAAPDILAGLKKLGSLSPTIRTGHPNKAGYCVTDNGFWIIDAPFQPLSNIKTHELALADLPPWDVARLASAILILPGVVEVGLFQSNEQSNPDFSQKPHLVYLGSDDGNYTILSSI